MRTIEEKLELADQKVAQLSKLPEVQHELTQVRHFFLLQCRLANEDQWAGGRGYVRKD